MTENRDKKQDLRKEAFALLGGVDGVKKLANLFYDEMEQWLGAAHIRGMHPDDLDETRENLGLFLCGWLGGPPLYREKFGRVDLTGIHARFEINESSRDDWLTCMERTLKKMELADDLRHHLLERFAIPAEKIRFICQQQMKGIPVLLPSELE